MLLCDTCVWNPDCRFVNGTWEGPGIPLGACIPFAPDEDQFCTYHTERKEEKPNVPGDRRI